ncbi:uncharacterized protein BCR38DRAFT_334823 [Pseudomassariella vexata]|uniref:P-loop containing nucleoside triphosphate hydrolase protein n=1 Tax=Pseudomassariella vexata TaxID=1141098 RepID=A0A1Y2EBS2_9PEZI|nr:uncharacterized protein BCR38DRAFT_334823 [Pseudomassariella vexata]ORY68867.1 hypothetical protein BCR38DRAFT_334823 [Pseudomassariella vexata]
MSDQSSRPPRKLVQMSGAPGSGKSAIARLLAHSIDGVVINHDLIKAFFLDTGIPFDQSAKLTYRLDWVLAEDMIKQERSVIIDSVCNYPEVIDRGTALAQKYRYDYKYVECRITDLDLLDQRMRSRESLRSQRTGVDRPPPDAMASSASHSIDELFKKWIENPCRPVGDCAIIVDSTRSPEECLDTILKQMTPPTDV